MSQEMGQPIQYVPNWTRYDHQEFFGRISILIEEIAHIHRSRFRDRTKEQISEEALSWAYHTESVPTNYLGEACTRAAQSWRSAYSMPSSAVLVAWEEIAAGLTEGYGPPAETDEWKPHDYVGLREWKERHGLPRGWKWGDPFPESSDLYGRPTPVQWSYYPNAQRDPGEVPLPPVKRDPRWFTRKHAPWELYGTVEAPIERDSLKKRTRQSEQGHVYTEYVKTRVVAWCERCPTIDFGDDVTCPGYVTKYIVTTEVESTRRETREVRHQCPLHYR